MHYNENARRKQAVTKRGEKQYSVLFPKYKKGGHTVRKVLEDCSYNHHVLPSVLETNFPQTIILGSIIFPVITELNEMIITMNENYEVTTL